MSLTITSSTDSDTDVKAALGNQTRLEGKEPSVPQVTEEKPAGDEPEVVASGTTESAQEVEKPTEPGKVEEKSPAKNLDKRFAKLTRQRKEAEARAEESTRIASYWENEAKKLRDSVKPAEAAQETKSETKPSGEPKADDFGTYQEYVDAKIEWKLKAAEAERERKASIQATKEAADNIWKSYTEKEKAFMKERPDLQERIDTVKEAGIRMSPIVEDRILRTGPELAYELMKDPEEFKALCAMAPNEALEHIGVVKAQMKAQATKPVEKAEVKPQPKPVSPVGARATVVKDPEKMSIKEYDRWRREGNSPTA